MKTGLESLDVGAPEITYSGNQGPKSPQEDQRMMQEFQMAQLQEEYDKHVFEMEEMGMEPMSMQQFIEQVMSEAQMSSNQQGIGTMMQEPRTMAAFGGIMGADGRRAYGGGGSQDSVRGGGYQGRGGETTGGGAGSQAGGAGTGTDNQGSTGGGNDRDDSGDDVARPTYSEQYQNLPKADEQDVREQVRLGNTLPDGRSAIKVNQVIPYAQELIGKTSYDVIPGDEENEEERRRANEAIAEERRLAFEEEERRRREEERQRLILLSQQGGNRDIAEFVATQMPDEEDEEDDEEEYNLARTQRLSLPFDFSVNTDDLTQGRGGFLYNDGGRAGYAGGGIADLRQGYFLGKLVKKATRGIKKIAKSKFGKMALLAAGAYFLYPTMASTSFGKGLGTFLKKGAGKALLNKGVDATAKGAFSFANLDPFKAFSTATSLYPLVESGINKLRGKDDDEEDFDFDARKQKFIDANPQFKNPFPFKRNALPFANGGDVDDDDKNLSARAALAKAKKFYASGGLAGLPPVTMMSEGQDIQSFPDDESTGIAQATPQDQMPMPARQPMMNPMMARGMMDPRMMQRQPRIMAQEGGMMDMGGMEKDYRNDGGFVPIGGQERADDVPARLSKNEFVFTADAVRNAGGGNIDKGAEIMENLMENLEQGGKVSKASQGLSGAREMFATQQRLGEVL